MVDDQHTDLPRSPKDASALSLAFYFTGKPCKHGHISRRYVSCKSCVECVAIKSLQQRRSNPKRHVEIVQRYRARHPERYKATLAKLYAHRARLRKEKPGKEAPNFDSKAYNRRWRAENREYCRVKTKAWRAADPDRARASRRRSAKNNPETVMRLSRARRARKRGASGSHSAADLREILKLQKGRCANCRRKFCKSRPSTLDHIVALKNGGSHDRFNVQFLCGTCNSSKGATDAIEFAQRQGKLL